MNNKGQVNDTIFVMITLTSIAIVSVIAAFVYFQIDDAFDSSNIQSAEAEAAYDAFGSAWGIIDGSFVFIVFGLTMALLVSSFFIPTHPIFLVINIVGFLILVFMGAVFANVYSDVTSQEGLNSSVTTFPITTFMVSKLPWIGAAIIFLSTIILYAKGRSEEFG